MSDTSVHCSIQSSNTVKQQVPFRLRLRDCISRGLVRSPVVEAEEIAQLAKYSLCNPGDQRLILQTFAKNSRSLLCVCNPALKGRDRRIWIAGWPASLAESVSSRQSKRSCLKHRQQLNNYKKVGDILRNSTRH